MRALLTALLFSTIACGGSSEPQQHGAAPTQPAVEHPPTPPSTPVRTMKNVPLFGETSVQNLLIDPTFEDGDPGIGRWYVNITTGGLPLDQTVSAASPMGMSLPIGVITGFPDGAMGAPKGISMLAQLPGGKGPYSVSLWAATESPVDQDFDKLLHVTIAQITGAKGLDIALDPTATRVIGGRTWYRFSGIALDDAGKAIPSFTLGAILKITMPASRTKYWLQAPEVVPKPLADVAGMKIVNTWRDLTSEERLEIQAMKKIPLDHGIRSIGQKKVPL
ncbi:MAG: hypothetical protein ACXVEF_30350 [Polyangiales bacterium]